MIEHEKPLQRILVVDDTQKNIQVIGAILREKGYLISIASSGEMALTTLEKTLPDLILLDIMMPGMDGYETCKKIKENPKTKDVPVMFLSALTESWDKVKAFKYGAVDYVTKPIEAKELLARVSAHLKIDSLQKELRYINKNLEYLVDMRTHELDKTKSYLSNVINSMPTSIIGVDVDGNIVNLNHEAEHQASLYIGDIERKQVFEVFPVFSKYLKEILSSLKDGVVYSRDKVLIESGNNHSYYNISSYPIYVNNEITGGVIRIDDVTEAMKLERLKIRFEKEKMAALGDIVIGVAHELNTPIGGAITAASSLKQKTIVLEQQYTSGEMKQADFNGYMKATSQYETMILETMERAAEIVSQFKGIAVDYRQDEISCFDLKERINMLLQTMAIEIKDINCNVDLNCPENLEVKLQPKSFDQIFGNLISNSIKHGFYGRESGEITIYVDSNPDLLKITYSDNGKGVPKGDEKKIFAPFYTTKRGTDCLGLGLSIVYNLVTLKMEGKIEVVNKPGSGLIYKIEIPQIL